MTNLKMLGEAELHQFLNKDVILDRSIPTAIEKMSIVVDMDVDVLSLYNPVAINREFKRRVKKQTPNFQKDLTGQKVFTVFNVTKNLKLKFHGEEIPVKPGMYVADGNTRLEAFRQGKINLPKEVICQIIQIDNEKSFIDEYYAIDNTDSAENSGDLIRGAVIGHELNVTSKVAMNGNFASALRNAYPHKENELTINKVAFFKKEIELLDECGIFLPTEHALKHQHFYGACLIAAKLYSKPGTTALKFKGVLQQLSRIEAETMSTSGDKWNGITALVYQCANPNKKGWIPEDAIAKTNYASVEPSYNFYLYCLELAMNDKLLHRTRGFKNSNWAKYYEDALDSIR